MQTALLVVPPALALAPRASLLVAAIALVAFVMALRTLVDRRHRRAAWILALVLLMSTPAAAHVLAPVFSGRNIIVPVCSPPEDVWSEIACWLCSIGLC